MKLKEKWSFLKGRFGFHSHQLNSLLLKIGKSRYLEKMSGASVIGIGETKLDDYTLSNEIEV